MQRPDRLEQTQAAWKLTLAEAMAEWLRLDPPVKTSHAEVLRLDRLKKHHPTLLNRPLLEIDTRDIQDFIAERSTHAVEPSTVNRDLAAISRTFNFARARLGCSGLSNPIVPGVRLRESGGRVRRLESDEKAMLMAHARAYEALHGVPIASIIQVALGTAMRLSEIARMQWEHLSLNDSVVHLPETKNGSGRHVPLSADIRDVILAQGRAAVGRIWPEKEAIRSAWRRVRDAAAAQAEASGQRPLAERIRTFRFHDLRHEATSWLIENTDLNLEQIRSITGHKTVTMLSRYTHPKAGKLVSALNRAKRLDDVHDAQAITSPAEPVAEITGKLAAQVRWKIVSQDAAMMQMLVDSRPITRIASEFGVSDVAVHKACQRLGVQKAARGHWLRKDGK
ncbi:site-specific integrase [Sinimarinibacterium sp. NLF-5-8]|uniref:tyrosine-type recombinase/integrase n=1 Tax=Sinimarinibacterium sp. NLF-5-8 TaxID=2698684 RepID=UPI00137BE1BB|nr:site-specific integrase [Sinimarinibacterium sp. NLF-5-8]QHS08984.1 site-specific integrase [Sinimarinibacterium sp. NLF-5-8]